MNDIQLFSKQIRAVLERCFRIPERMFHTLYYGEGSKKEQDAMVAALNYLWNMRTLEDLEGDIISRLKWRLHAAIEYVEYHLQHVMTDGLRTTLEDVKKKVYNDICQGINSYPPDYPNYYWTEWEETLRTVRGKEYEWIDTHHIDHKHPRSSAVAHY